MKVSETEFQPFALDMRGATHLRLRSSGDQPDRVIALDNLMKGQLHRIERAILSGQPDLSCFPSTSTSNSAVEMVVTLNAEGQVRGFRTVTSNSAVR